MKTHKSMGFIVTKNGENPIDAIINWYNLGRLPKTNKERKQDCYDAFLNYNCRVLNEYEVVLIPKGKINK